MSTARRILRWIARVIFLWGLTVYVLGQSKGRDRTAESTNVCVVAIGIYTLFPRPRYARRRYSRNPERIGLWERDK